jgi:hypothetical protein
VRCLAVVATCVALATIAAFSAVAARAATGEPACRAAEVRQHHEAVFGHFANRADALKLKARAQAQGFQGIKIEDDGCGDFEVEIDGADTQATRTSFAKEAARAGFQVTFEQTAPPMAFKQGEVVGIFAAKRTLAEANALMQRLATVGFRYIDIARSPTRWLVVMPQVPVKQALPIAREVSTAGFQITFRSGAK